VQRFYRVVYRVDKKDDPATAFERVEDAVSQSGSRTHRIVFLFLDVVLGREKSALDHLVKCYPVFEPYRTTVKLLPTRETHVITGDGIPAETLLEIARGIPRRFPFGTATFAWQDVAALDFTPELPQPDNTAANLYARLAGRIGMAGITLVSTWAVPKRSLDLTAAVRLNSDTAAGKRPEFPQNTRSLLDAIGKRKTDDVFAVPDSGETHEVKAALSDVDDAFKRGRALLVQRLPALPLKPLELRARDVASFDSPGSVKEPLAHVLAELGYALARGGGSGTMLFAKRTPEGHELRVSVDRGTWANHFAGRFEIRSERWVRSMSIPLAAGDFPGQAYNLIDERQIQSLCRNLATVVAEIERVVYPRVRDALAVAPAP
jgi:hypothetical protein